MHKEGEAMTTLREAAQQAREALEYAQQGRECPSTTRQAIADLRAALAQQAELSEGLGPLPPTTYVLARESDGYSPERLLSEAGYTEEHMRAYAAAAVALERDSRQALPVAGKVVAWGVFAKIDGEWQLQHPVFAGDEQGKVNAEFERASYSGPQPLEVRPLGVVTATAQQAEPVQDQRCRAEPRSDGDFVCDCKIGECLGRSAEPAQEPVAYIHRQGNHWEVSERHLDSDEKSRGWTEEPLYTAPPQRQPLTAQQLDGVIERHVGGSEITDDEYASMEQFARAVERAHGIKE